MRPETVIEQIQRLLAAYPELGEDEDFRRDVLEGQTSLGTVMERLCRVHRALKAEAAGLEAAQAELGHRAESKHQRITTIRTTIAALMEAAALDKFKTDSASISLGAPSRSVLVTDVDLLPEQYRKVTVAPVKIEIKRALEAGALVPGASLTNGERPLRIS